MTEVSSQLATISRWLDESYPAAMSEELKVRRRVDKLMEEVGEVGEALSGWFGENPRKGQTHTKDDLLKELLDVMVTAGGAYESLTGNRGIVMAHLKDHLSSLLFRVGLEQPDIGSPPTGGCGCSCHYDGGATKHVAPCC